VLAARFNLAQTPVCCAAILPPLRKLRSMLLLRQCNNFSLCQLDALH